jgi:glutamyl-tRNA synthetase
MTRKSKPARVRFAPSPTGRVHLGSARTALYDFLLARRTGGQFVLRIEDTDRRRYVEGAEQELVSALRWLGLEWDEGPDVGGPYGPYRQSERKGVYLEYAKRLVESGNAYPCFCTPERLEKVRQEQQKGKLPLRYDGTCRRLAPEQAARRVAAGEKYVIRFKMPYEGTTTVHDHLRGDIVVENRTLDDYIIVKSDGWALYHLAAVVDDHLMEITHVIRTAEWLPTFPLHALIVRAFGWAEPVWIHPSVFLKPSGKGKMSKRDDAQFAKGGHSIYLKDLEQLGYVPEAVVNWTVLMGWGYSGSDVQDEFFTMQSLIEKFDIDHLNPSPAAVNFTKLDHFNGMHIRRMSDRDLASRLRPFLVKAGYTVDDEKLVRISPIVRERLVTLDDVVVFAGFFFREGVEPAPEELIGKKMDAAESAVVVRRSYEVLAALPQITPEAAEPPMRRLVDSLGLSAGQVFGILRVAITGQKVSPPLFESMAIIGKEAVLERIKNAATVLEQM